MSNQRKTLATADPLIGENVGPDGGARHEVRITMTERIRRKQKLKADDPETLEVLKARALLEGHGAMTELQKQSLLMETREAKRTQKTIDVVTALQRAQDGAAGEGQRKARAQAERAILAAGGEPTKEIMASLGFHEDTETKLPDNLQTNVRASQRPPVRDDTKAPLEDKLDPIAMAVLEALSKERAAKAAALSGHELQGTHVAEMPSGDAVAHAMAVLEAQGFEVVEKPLADTEEPEAPKVPKKRGRPKMTQEQKDLAKAAREAEKALKLASETGQSEAAG